MPVVKLISNPNRTMNPFKGQFLNQIYNHDSEILKGRLAKEGKFIFTYYQQLIDLDDYIVEYFKNRIESKKETKIKWDFYEDLRTCFVYYKLKLKNDSELESIWDELNLLAKKTDLYVEEKMVESHEQASKKSDIYLTVIFNKAGQIVKDLITQPFFKRTMKLVSDWIQLIAKYRDLSVNVQTKTNLQGLKYDVFSIQLKQSNVEIQTKNIEEIKQKYIEYDKALVKIKLSSQGAFTETRKDGDDTLEVAYAPSVIPKKTDKQAIIKTAKQEKFNQLFPKVDSNMSQFELGDNIWISKKDILSLTNNTVDEFIENEKKRLIYNTLENLIRPHIQSYLSLDNFVGFYENPSIANDYKTFMTIVFKDFLSSENFSLTSIRPEDVSLKSFIETLNENHTSSEDFCDSFIDKEKSFFIDPSQESNVKKTQLCKIFQDLMEIYPKALTALNDLDYILKDEEPLYAQIKDIVNQLSYYDTPAFTKSPLMNEQIKKIEAENNSKTKMIYSEQFGEINATPDKSAYQIYQEMKAESTIKAKFLKNAQPMLRGDTLSFVSKNKEISIQRIPNWENIVVQNKKLERDIELSNDLASNNPNRLTMQVKVLPVMVNKEKVNLVTTGKFKGFTLEDLTNVMGRFLGDGKSYSVDTNGQVISNFETLSMSDSSPVINNDVLEEPYITWTNGKFVLGLPVNASNERKSLKKLSLEMTINGNYLFTASDYLSIKDCLGSCLLSQKAHEELQKYYAKLQELEKSQNEENLKKYTSLAIGGFKSDLNPSQIQALSWLDGNDLKGLYCTNNENDKMMVALGAIKIALKKKASAKFLILTDDTNVGIFKAYIASELNEVQVVSESVKEIGYSEFKKMVKSEYDFKSEFYAILIDYKNEKDIQGLDHPRKIFLTLKDLNKSPKELYRLSLLAKNQEIDQEKEKAFLNKYAINIGGKFVGIKPELNSTFIAWSKENVHINNNKGKEKENRFFAEMSKDIVKAYREVATELKKQILDLQEKYLEEESTEEVGKQAQIALSEKIGLLNLFKADQKFESDSSKVIKAVEIGHSYISNFFTRNIVYFTSDDDLAKEMVISLSHKIRGKIHVLCLTNYIQFYQNGMPLKKGKVTRQTDLGNFVLRTAKEGSMDWIKKTIKDFIINNKQICTLVCNSSYTGVKLKNFETIVHLDEGGWDNDLMAKRKASGDYENELIINSVYPESATENDQIAINPKFYNEVLDTVLKIDQTIGYIPEQVKVSDQTSLSKFKRVLLPTRQEMLTIDSLMKGKKEKPLSNTTLDPNRFNHPTAKALLDRGYYSPGYADSLKQILDLSGASGILNVASENIRLTMVKEANWDYDFFEAEPDSDDWIKMLSRGIESDAVENKVFKAHPCAPASLGNRALFTQLVAMKQAGKSELVTYGVGDYTAFDKETGRGLPNAFIGYYIWPKFGYNANISLDMGKLKEFAKMYRDARNSFFTHTNTKQKPVLIPMTKSKPLSLSSYEQSLDLSDFDPLDVSEFLDVCTKDLSVIYGNTSEYWKEQLDSYGYFKERNRNEELEYANENRLVLFYRERHNTVFPYHKKNLVDPKDIDFGHGRYFEDRSIAEIVEKNNLISASEDSTQEQQWNGLLSTWKRNPNYKKAMAKLNGFYDGILSFSSDEENEMKKLYIARKLKEHTAIIEEYEIELKNYELRKIEYETNLKLWEAEEKEMDNSILPVDKSFIQNAILEKKFSDDVKFFMFSGKAWYHMGFARCAYYILKEIEKGLKIDDVLTLYGITFKDENGVSIKAGEEWWKFVGRSTNYSLDISSEETKSYKHLVSYMNSKVKEAGYETLEEYLSSPIEPFDINSLDCCLSFFKEGILSKTTREEKIQILETYSKNLKNAFQKAGTPSQEILTHISLFEAKHNLKIPLPFERKKFPNPSKITRVANIKASHPVKEKSFEQLMYQVAEEDKDILDAISLEQKAVEQALILEKEIKELKGDLKP
jgi:hypothetical protein